MLWRKVTPPATKKHINQVIGRLLSVADGTTFEIVQPETLLGRVPDAPRDLSRDLNRDLAVALDRDLSRGFKQISIGRTRARRGIDPALVSRSE